MDGKRKSLFKTNIKKTTSPDDPEALFRDLKSRSEEIRHLWSHQADLLRSYHENYVAAPDVALELPTGAGKTLVGLLIGEFRRRKFEERVAYLCPTRQLAKQVGEHSLKYGIPSHVLVGKQAEYPTKDFNDYQTGRAIAITTYSAVFNINPRIDAPNTLILDDAHAGENYISDLWSMRIIRDDHPTLFMAIIDIFASVLQPRFVDSVKNAQLLPPGQEIEMVPGIYFRERHGQLSELCDEHLKNDHPAFYSWSIIKHKLFACNLFISSSTLLVRPLIPPSLNHSAFAKAAQRVYMSATLGAGGELERITGIAKIDRLPIPAGWDKQGSGRRLFLIPGFSLNEDSCYRIATDSCKKAGRVLVLVPDNSTRLRVEKIFLKESISVLEAKDIENSLTPFTSKNDIALILANRYDGIDLPGDSCRLLVVAGLPIGTNLQEKFLYSRLAATCLLRDRVLTRLTQAFGRCTRSDTDFATVILIGQDLNNFILKGENRTLAHPELQAELIFGIENSKDISQDKFLELFTAFIEQMNEWKNAEGEILSIREECIRKTDVYSAPLMSIVGDEVAYCYSLWKNDFNYAFEKARKIADALEGNEIKGYRAWWYYLVGDLALKLYEEENSKEMLTLAQGYFKRAATCSLSISWFSELSRIQIEGQNIAETDKLVPIAVESIYQRIQDLGFVGQKFEKYITTFMSEIQDDKHKAFHHGLKKLGELLGFNAYMPTETSAPDGIWCVGNHLYITHEAKTEQTVKGEIGTNDVRQAASHINWVKEKFPIDRDTKILCLIESHRTKIEKNAIPHSGDLYHVTPVLLRDIAGKIVSTIRSFRSEAIDSDDSLMAEILREGLEAQKLLPADIVATLSTTKARDLSG